MRPISPFSRAVVTLDNRMDDSRLLVRWYGVTLKLCFSIQSLSIETVFLSARALQTLRSLRTSFADRECRLDSLEIFESHGKALRICKKSTVPKNTRTQSFSLVSGEQIRFPKPDVTIRGYHQHSDEPVLLISNLKKRLVVQVLPVRLSLVCRVPTPAFDDVRPKGAALDFERKVKGFVASRQ